MAGNKDSGLKTAVIVLSLVVLLVTGMNFLFAMYLIKGTGNTTGAAINRPIEISIPKTSKIFGSQEKEVSIKGERKVVMWIPAVDSNGHGVMAKLIVEARPGKGRTLVDINNILFWIDIQNSIRTAERVAARYLNMSLDNVDLIYTIKTNASIIEGPSAGAALTIATIAVLENKTIKPGVTITGTINSDGTIGPVGGVLEKAEAAKKFGMKMILVPLGQAEYVTYIPKKDCEKYGMVTFCQTEWIPKKIDISKEVGIKVVEVSNIAQALKYFIS